MSGTRIFGTILVVLSVLWLLACSGCTYVFLQGSLSPTTNEAARAWYNVQTPMALIIGGACALPGIVVLLIGLVVRAQGPRTRVADGAEAARLEPQ
jgi:hypothetical protein